MRARFSWPRIGAIFDHVRRGSRSSGPEINRLMHEYAGTGIGTAHAPHTQAKCREASMCLIQASSRQEDCLARMGQSSKGLRLPQVSVRKQPNILFFFLRLPNIIFFLLPSSAASAASYSCFALASFLPVGALNLFICASMKVKRVHRQRRQRQRQRRHRCRRRRRRRCRQRHLVSIWCRAQKRENILAKIVA